MEVTGSIDNASGTINGGRKAVYHLIFTRSAMIAARVLLRREEIQKNPIRTGGGGLNASMEKARELQQSLIEEAFSRGKEIEKSLEAYVNSRPEGLVRVDYSEVTDVILSGGNPFFLPYVRFAVQGGNMKFRLIRNNFHGTGKLDSETMRSYKTTLKEAFQEKLRVK